MGRLGRFRSTALGAGGLLAVALMAGRLSGLGRELLLASRFGVSAQADVAIVLLTLPDLLVNLLLSGGLSAALVPRLRGLPADQAARLFRNAGFWALAVFGLMAMVIAFWPASVFAALAPGLEHPARLVGHSAMLLLAISIPLTALAGVTAAYLNAVDRFFVAGLGTLIFNLAIIMALLWWSAGNGLFVLTAAIAAGATIRLFSQAAILPRQAWRVGAGTMRVERAFLAAFAAGIAATSLSLLPPAFVRAAASFLGTGNIATFNYAQKLVELPVGILITTISTIALTRLSGYHADGDVKAARGTLYANLRLSLLLAIMIVLFGEFLAEAIVTLIFMRGAIDGEGVAQIARLTRVILLGVPFIAFGSLAAVALNAQLRTQAVLQATLASIGTLALLVLPGLLLSSDVLLMGAVVGSQALLAWFLARRAGICLWGEQGIADRRSLEAIGAGLAVAIPFAIIAALSDIGNGVVAIGLGAAGFAAAVGASVAVHRRAARYPMN